MSSMPTANDNPFRSERIDALPYRLSDTTWDDLLGKLESLHYRAAIVGPHGSGKTTLLDTLVPLLEDRWERIIRITLGSSSRRLSREQHLGVLGSSKHTLIVVDGAEQLPWFSWMLLRLHSGRAGGLVITTHQPGRLPTLIACRPSLETASALTEALAPGAIPPERLAALFERHRGNLRELFRALYDEHA